MAFPKFSRSGFTMIEMIIVMVIVAIMLAVALPNIDMARFRADAGMRSVQGVLQRAERNAVQRQTDVMVSFDFTNSRMRTVFDLNNNHVIDAGEYVRWTPLDEGNIFAVPPIGVNGAVARAVIGNNVSTSADGLPTIYYHRDGASSSAIEVYLHPSSTVNTDEFRAVLVTQASGRVTLYHYGNGQWRQASM